MSEPTKEQIENFEKLRSQYKACGGIPQNDWLQKPDDEVFKSWPRWRQELYKKLYSAIKYVDTVDKNGEHVFTLLNESLRMIKNNVDISSNKEDIDKLSLSELFKAVDNEVMTLNVPIREHGEGLPRCGADLNFLFVATDKIIMSGYCMTIESPFGTNNNWIYKFIPQHGGRIVSGIGTDIVEAICRAALCVVRQIKNLEPH